MAKNPKQKPVGFLVGNEGIFYHISLYIPCKELYRVPIFPHVPYKEPVRTAPLVSPPRSPVRRCGGGRRGRSGGAAAGGTAEAFHGALLGLLLLTLKRKAYPCLPCASAKPKPYPLHPKPFHGCFLGFLGLLMGLGAPRVCRGGLAFVTMAEESGRLAW